MTHNGNTMTLKWFEKNIHLHRFYKAPLIQIIKRRKKNVISPDIKLIIKISKTFLILRKRTTIGHTLHSKAILTWRTAEKSVSTVFRDQKLVNTPNEIPRNYTRVKKFN